MILDNLGTIGMEAPRGPGERTVEGMEFLSELISHCIPDFPYPSLKPEGTIPCDKYLKQEFGGPPVKFMAYDSFFNCYFYSEITMEYAAFADVVSTGSEGNPNFKD